MSAASKARRAQAKAAEGRAAIEQLKTSIMEICGVIAFFEAVRRLAAARAARIDGALLAPTVDEFITSLRRGGL